MNNFNKQPYKNSYRNKRQFLFLLLVIYLVNYSHAQQIDGGSTILKKVFITQTYTYSYKSHDHNHYVNETVFCENAPFNNMSLGFHYNLHFPNHIEFLSNISYTYENDKATYKQHYMDDYGVSEVHYKAHLISFDAGIKFFIPRKWNRLYFRV